MYQPVLFDLEDIFDKPLRRYELFFSVLDLTLLEKSTSIGRKPISRASLRGNPSCQCERDKCCNTPA